MVKNKERRTHRHTQANIMMKRDYYFYTGGLIYYFKKAKFEIQKQITKNEQV
jgi:hypothetical protein